MKRCFLLGAFVLSMSLSVAQDNVSILLDRVEENNLTLRALRADMDAQKLGNHAEARLADPEVDYHHLWGNPAGIGLRRDVSVAQQFDMATITGLKSRVAKRKDELADWKYRAERMNVLLEAKLAYLDMVYCNAMHGLLAERKERAQSLVDLQQVRLDAGDGNLLDLNNAKLALVRTASELMGIEAEQNAVHGKLEKLNGGNEVRIVRKDYDEVVLPPDFAEWFSQKESQNPMLAYLRQHVVVSKKEVALRRTRGLPSFSAGYMGEFTQGERYQGLMFGMTIPIWSNKVRVRQAKTALTAAQMRQADERLQQLTELESLYRQAESLRKSMDDCRKTVASANNIALLQKALQEGEVSVMEYLQQVGMCYDVFIQLLRLERDYQKTCAALSAMEL